jgi:tRNA A-37 threonylcarbamoyl transferase component Bud32
MPRGRASTVTALDERRVLRVGGNPAREAGLMALAAAHGFPVPLVDEVRADALVLERIAGRTMGEELRRAPWTARKHVLTLARLHDELHGIPLDGASLLHLDLHPENIIVSPRGPVVIDWTNAGAGEPAKDVALTWLILQTSAGVPGRILARLFASRVSANTIREGIAAASAFRLADPNVTDAERARVLRTVS